MCLIFSSCHDHIDYQFFSKKELYQHKTYHISVFCENKHKRNIKKNVAKVQGSLCADF